MRRAGVAALRVLKEAGHRPGLVEAVLRLTGVGLAVAFATFYGLRWALLAGAVGLFVLTSEHQL